MSDWLKLVQCKQIPSSLFTIFDYSKLVYPIDGGFCLREMVNRQQKPVFIDVKRNLDQIIWMYGAQHHIITIEKKQQSYFVCFYTVAQQQKRIRISPTLQSKISSIHCTYTDGNILLCISSKEGNINQLIFFDCKVRRIIARGFVDGEINEIKGGPNCSISVMMGKKIVGFKNQPTGIQQVCIGRIYKEIQADVPSEMEHHYWIEQQLFVWNKIKLCLIFKNKIVQQFQGFYRLHNSIPMTSSFLVCDGGRIKIYKKKDIKYQLVCQLVDEHLMDCSNIILAPQQDVIAYYSPISHSICYSTSFMEQMQQSQLVDRSESRIVYLKTREINHEIMFNYAIYTGNQAWFAITNGKRIELVNSGSYQQYLEIQLENQCQNNFSLADAKVRYIDIHPCKPILAVALKKTIRLYYITFSQVKILKQFNYSNCSYLLFNHSGSMLVGVVSGKGGAKLYIFRINQIKSQYNLIQVLTIPKKPLCLFWDSLDSKLFCFFNKGYYQWGVDGRFKNRKQVALKIKYQIAGAILTKQDQIALWGEDKLSLISNQQILSQQTLKTTTIKQIYSQGEWYYFILSDGRITKNKTLQLQMCIGKGIEINVNKKNYQIYLQENNKFIYLDHQCNIKFYQFGNNFNCFNDIVSIQRKKLYHVMNKHKQYQQEIGNIKLQFSNVIKQLKFNNNIEQQKKQQQYRLEMKDHVQRQKRAKDQKIRLEQMMETNIQIQQKQAMNQVKDLQRLYQRKLALTTNKLLTQKQIGFRDRLTSQNNLKLLQQRHSNDVQNIRQQFGDQLSKNIMDKNEAQRQMNKIKKQYQAKLYELEEQNEIILKQIRQKYENNQIGLKRIAYDWENKYSQCLSKKDNVEQQLKQQLTINQALKQRIQALQTKKIQSQRRCQHLSNEITKIQKVLQQRNKKLQYYEKRIQDLQKSNQILKYRVLEVKQQSDPYQDQVSKLKINLTDLQQQYDKIVKYSHQQQQKIIIIIKQKNKIKSDLQLINQKYLKINKRHQQLLDKIRQTTKSPIQEIRRQLLSIVDNYAKIQKSYAVMHNRVVDSPLGQLNRIRDHLQVCLQEAVTSSKKNEQQRKIQVIKRSHQNSQLLLQINTMRKKIRELQDQIKEKDVKIGRLIRGETPPIIYSQKRVETTQAQSKQFTKTRSIQKQTFYQKSLFKSGTQWNQRLKTQQTSRRKKSTHSMTRDRNQNASLSIYPPSEEIQEYKRIIQQKDIFIRKLIAKIQKI